MLHIGVYPMIPKNIKREHILSAIQEIDQKGIPKNRQAHKFQLVLADNLYSPKYVVSLANKYANGVLLKPSEFGGGNETNSFLRNLGFTITDKAASAIEKNSKSRVHITPKTDTKRHNERCPACKKTIENLMRKLYGEVYANYRFEMGVTPYDFKHTNYYHALNKIFIALQESRGHKEFVRTVNLPRVDYYVPSPGFILEFDESQHFTTSRKVALTNYPDSLDLGFEISKWINLCEQIDSHDNDPPFRDEQRAWYDTLRDFLPTLKNLLPTIRLFSKDTQWCNLDPDNEQDLRRFQKILDKNQDPGNSEVITDPSPDLARIVIAGNWQGEIDDAKIILEKVVDHWPDDKRVDCLITCGAFIKFIWPADLLEIGDNKFPDQAVVNTLISAAEKACKKLLDQEIRQKLQMYTDYITIGVDSKKDKVSLSYVSIRKLHAELVALVDLKSNKYYWTGKSYPTAGQEDGLVRIKDLSTHFVDLSFGKVLILGCHDLNIFSRRGKKTTKTKWRKDIRSSFYRLIKKEKPGIVLHHPHTTDSSRIWTPAWNELEQSTDSIHNYLGAGVYYNENGERSSLHEVLGKTKKGQSIDFIVRQ